MQRQIKSCTHCRQHKVRCDASKCYPKPCTRCSKFNLVCVVDQNFKPRKGGQVELLREHLAKIQEQIHNISKTSTGAVDGENVDFDELRDEKLQHATGSADRSQQHHHLPDDDAPHEPAERAMSVDGRRDSAALGDEGFVHRELPLKRMKLDSAEDGAKIKEHDELEGGVKEIEASVAERMAAGGRLVPVVGPYCLEDLVLEEPKADQLHDYFMENCAPYMPIFESGSAGELYARSEFLFWAVMVVAAQGEPGSELYLQFVGPVKRLAAKKSLLATTRSSSVVQALLVLSTWPLPSEKILEDMSPRYASLAYSMGLQLGIHRGKFIYEFSRNQQLMPNAVKWRSRTWVQTYITQQMVSAASGIPPSMPVDFIIDHALHDEVHPLSPRIAAFLKFAMFYSKLVSIMGTRIGTQDGLMEPESRCPTLELLKTDLYTMFPSSSKYDDPVIEIMYLYARCIMDSFAFLPETPLSYQSGFVVDAFQASTRIVTLVRQLVGSRKMLEFPSFIRNPCNYAALTLFRLQSMPQFPDQYVASARESVVTIHHMYRNIPPSWLDSRVSNDISRIAKILESLNHVMMIHPELLRSRRVMRRMRSHLSFSLFYELIYIIHEAQRRNAQKKNLEGHEASGADQEASEVASTGGDVAGSDDVGVNSQQPHERDVGDRASHPAPATTAGPSSSSSEKGLVPSSAAAATAGKGGNKMKRRTNSETSSSPDSWTADDSPAHTGAMHQLINKSANAPRGRDMNPLPLFNNIDRKSYLSSTVVSPNGTTMTKLVPANGDAASAGRAANDSKNPHYAPPSSSLPSADGKASLKNVPAHVAHVDPHFAPPIHPAYPVQGQNGAIMHGHIETYPDYAPRMNDAESMGVINADLYTETQETNFGVQQIFEGIDWMNTEGDDFLGWMLPRNE